MMPNLKSCRVLVTSRSYAQNDPRLRTELESTVGDAVYSPADHPLSSSEVKDLLPGCHGYIAGLDVIDRPALQAADRLKIIARYGVGVDKIDLDAAAEMGIVVTNTPGANAASVAELTVGLMLSLTRSIPDANAAVKAGQWPRLAGMSLKGKTIGLLGLGAIGKQVARRLRGFDCTILAYDPMADTVFAEACDVQLKPQHQVISQADLLSLHLPVLPETRGMVDTAFLSQMKPAAFFINTARGELVDEGALLEALQRGHLRGAALDAFREEPPGPDNPLLALPQVIATPHTGAHTDGATNAMGWMALLDCLAVLRGQEPTHRVV
ncbi:MAG: phosphoglycerate dehydrogenase [Ardenticatenia bacterium]|nr:phosphoglycerate dehydrogenase [Ardenticatenia bacterium]